MTGYISFVVTRGIDNLRLSISISKESPIPTQYLCPYSTAVQRLTNHIVPQPSHDLAGVLPIMSIYQLAFFTPGRSPASASIRKLYCVPDISGVVIMPRIINMLRVWKIHVLELTLDSRKSLKIPLPFPPSIHRFLICVGRVQQCICVNCSCAAARTRGGRLKLRIMYRRACLERQGQHIRYSPMHTHQYSIERMEKHRKLRCWEETRSYL